MAYNKRIWKGRQGTGLNKFSIDGATPVTVVNQPDSLIEAGDALSAGNLNDLETRIDNAFNAVDAEVATKADETEVTELENTVQANTARIENLEQEHGGYYDVDVKSPYTIPSGKAKNWRVNVLRGVTRARNNLLANGNFASSNGWNASNATINSVSDNVLTFTASAQGGKIETSGSYKPVLASGHCYLFLVNVKLTTASTSVYMNNGYTHADCVSTTSWQTLASVATWNTTSGDWPYPSIVDNRTGSWDAIQVKEGGICDLNVHFGTSDLSFLGATDSAKLATIQTNYPELLVPSAYGSSLVSTRYGGARSVFKNLYSGASSVNVGGDASVSDYIDVLPSRNITISALFSRISGVTIGNSTINMFGVTFYDSSKTAISSSNVSAKSLPSGSTNVSGSATYSTPSGCYYIKVNFGNNNGDANVNTIKSNIQVEYGVSATTYSAYKTPQTLSLPTPVTLRSAGSVAEELDVKSGVVTRNIHTGSIGNGWSYNSTMQAWVNTTITDIKSDSDLLASDYLFKGTVRSTANVQALPVGSIAINDTYLFVKNGSDSVAPSGDLNYALATPTTEQLDPIQNPYLATESGGTISSILTDAVDDSMTLGYINL